MLPLVFTSFLPRLLHRRTQASVARSYKASPATNVFYALISLHGEQRHPDLARRTHAEVREFSRSSLTDSRFKLSLKLTSSLARSTKPWKAYRSATRPAARLGAYAQDLCRQRDQVLGSCSSRIRCSEQCCAKFKT